MREIVFDTETTGLDCLTGDRLIEIGCVELLNHIPTGRTFHAYINPRRPVAYEAALVHGLTDDFLRSQPGFEEVVDELSEFVGDSALIAHNAGFDRGFINMELGLCGRVALAEHRFVDTLVLARRRHPNAPNSLDALCARYAIDTSARAKQRRAARREDSGRGLSRAARRPAGEPLTRLADTNQRCDSDDRRHQGAPAAASASADRRGHAGPPGVPRDAWPGPALASLRGHAGSPR